MIGRRFVPIRRIRFWVGGWWAWGKLGSFGENPEVRIQNSGEGGPPLARVLSDGGWMDTVCNSPCFWCCFVPNYGTHYTIVAAKKQAFSGLNEHLVVSI